MLRPMNPLFCIGSARRAVWPLLLAAWLVSTVGLAAADNVLLVAVTNHTGWLIEGDSLAGAAYNRDAIRAAAITRADNSGSATGRVYSSVTFVRLVDTNGAAVPLRVSPTETNNLVGVTNSVNTGPGGAQNFTNAFVIRPTQRLQPHAPYRVQAFTFSPFTGSSDQDVLRTYLHFTNRVSPDNALNIIGAVTNPPSWNKLTAVSTVPGREAFTVSVPWTVWRYDNFANAVPGSDSVPLVFVWKLQDDLGNNIGLKSYGSAIQRTVSHFVSSVLKEPSTNSGTASIDIEPANGVQLDPVNRTYKLDVALFVTNSPGQFPDGFGTNSTSSSRLFHFNGELDFGPVQTFFTQLSGDPWVPPFVGIPPAIPAHLQVSGQSGVIVGAPNITYGNGARLGVYLQSNGIALFTTNVITAPGPLLTNVPVVAPNTPALDLAIVNGVAFVRTNTQLNASGGSSEVTALLPAGFGIRTNGASGLISSRLFKGNAPMGRIGLGAGLLPDSPAALTTAMFASVDSHPLIFLASALVWTPTLGAFSLTTVFPQHAANVEFSLTNGNRLSNNRHYQAISPGVVPLVTIGTSNGFARLFADFDYRSTGGVFTAHFPYGAKIGWTNGGQFRIRDGEISQTNGGSFLAGVTPVTVPYPADCIGCAATNSMTNVTVAPISQTLLLTRDGGLIANGAPLTNRSLAWGYIASSNDFANRIQTTTNVSVHVPGGSLRGGETVLPGDGGGAVLMLTGVDADNLSYLERPDFMGTPNFAAYQEGLADYAGVNYSVISNSARYATSILAGVKIAGWPLASRSKYYARASGVSGIHEATAGGFPSNAALYGYSIILSNYSLSFLDSENKDSRTFGSLRLPYPAGITQDFSNLQFSCPGGLLSAEIGGIASNIKRLHYWDADIVTRSLTFVSPDECSPMSGYVTMGVTAYASQFNSLLSGTLGFKTNGHIIHRDFALSVGLSDLDSRLKLSSDAGFNGPAGEKYQFVPSADAYYNDYAVRPVTGDGAAKGWINLAGTLNVPFFEDLRTHIQTGAQITNTTAPLHLMGGWPRESGKPNFGWRISGDDYFNSTEFDGGNRGWPGSLTTVEDYRESIVENYHPRAQRLWLGFVDFDYPLAWSTASRSFASWEPKERDFLILHTSSQVPYMSAEKLEMTFGLQYDGLPQINLANIAFDLVEDVTGVAKSVTDAVGDAAREALEEGLADFDAMLDDLPETIFDPVLDAVIDPTIGALQQQLSQAWSNTTSANWEAAVTGLLAQYIRGTVAGVPTNVAFNLRSLAQLNTNTAGLVRDLDQRLGRIDSMISTSRYLIVESPAGSGHRSVGSNLVHSLIGNLAPQYLANATGSALDSLLVAADPTFDAVDDTLGVLESDIGNIRSGIIAPGGLGRELNDAIIAASSDIDRASSNAAYQVQNWLVSIHDDIPYYTPEELKAEIRRKIDDAFYSEQVSATVKTILRAWFQEIDSAVREGVDSAMAQFNRTMRDLISQSLAEVDDAINPLVGEVNAVLGAGRVSGYAHFKGDSLDEARFDARWRWKVPDDLKFDGYAIIREINSGGDNTCSSFSGSLVEVTLGALDIGLEWIAPDLRADVAGKFAFNSNGVLIGLGGSFETTGEFTLEDTFTVTHLGAAAFFGLTENYLAATAELRFNGYEASGSLFFGKSCDLDPLFLVDPDVGKLIKNGSFSGAYAFGRVSIPVTEVVLGIPCSCFFCISASSGVGVGYRAEGHEFIGKIEAGVSGEAICLVNVYGNVTLVGSVGQSGPKFLGIGEVGGCIGHKPLEICHDFRVTLSYDGGKWAVDHQEK